MSPQNGPPAKAPRVEYDHTFPHFATTAIHAGYKPLEHKGHPVVCPIGLSTTFRQAAPGEHTGYEYSRSGNPTRDALEANLAALEGGKHGICFSSGLAALSTVFATLSSGDHALVMDDVYGGTNRYIQKVVSKHGIINDLVDMTNLEAVKKSMRPNTKLVWIETPTNPMMKIVDIAAVSKVAKEVNKDAIVLVDNTFATPYFQRPLSLGADVALHSITKYLNGHSDVVMGCVVLNSDSLAVDMRFFQNACGAVPSPFDSYLALRGIKTLACRMQTHQKSGLAVANYLATHSKVRKVIHPGLKSHPQYEVAARQMKGFSGMVTCYVDGNLDQTVKFLKNLKVFTLAESLGGYESLAEHPAIMTHSSVPEAERAVLGIDDSLVRLSVGLEDTQDLLDDLAQALAAAFTK